jgi:hypothetical protein
MPKIIVYGAISMAVKNIESGELCRIEVSRAAP